MPLLPYEGEHHLRVKVLSTEDCFHERLDLSEASLLNINFDNAVGALVCFGGCLIARVNNAMHFAREINRPAEAAEMVLTLNMQSMGMRVLSNY